MGHGVTSASEVETRQIGASLAQRLEPGDVVLLDGPLGAGKTTFVRGFLEGLGHLSGVRSPTFNLIQTFETDPPVMHADLYRVRSYEGIGLEDYMESHVCIVEWSDRLQGLVEPAECWKVDIQFDNSHRRIIVSPPTETPRRVGVAKDIKS